MSKFGGIIGLFIGLFLFSLLLCSPALAANGTIEGTVTWATDSSAINDMWIYAEPIDDPDDSTISQTEEDGTYSISVEPGTYVVYNLNYDGNNDYYMVIESEIITITDGLEVPGTDFSLTRQPQVYGNTYQSDGITAINDVSVYASDSSSYLYGSGYDYTGYDGSYSFYTFSGSDYSLAGDGYYDIYYRKMGYFGAIINDVSLSTENTHEQDVSLTAVSQVSGTVTDANSSALANVHVVLTDGAYTFSAITNSSGEYTIQVGDMYNYNGTAVASYTLTTSKEGYAESTKNIEIEADESALTENNFSLTQSGSIAGTIRNSAATKYLSGVTITAYDGYENTYTTTTSSDGTYSINNLNPSAKYKITASKNKYLTKNKYDQEVITGIETLANFKLTKGKKLSGKVKSKAGTKLKDATVSLYKRDEHYSTTADYTTTTKNNGQYQITGITPGNYRVQISKDGWVVKNIRKLKLKKNKTGKTYEIVKAASVYGRVTNSGTAVRGALIYVYGHKIEASEGYASTTTDSDGYYQITGLKKGTYRVKVLSTDHVSKTVKKDLKKGKQKTINFKVGLAGEISGHVIDNETKLPLSGYCVRVKGTSRYDCTDSGGYYIINGLAKANYELFVASDAYETLFYDKKVKVKADQTTKDINFNLTHKTN